MGPGGLLPGVSMNPGGRSILSKCRESCWGAAPMGAGLLPSTGAAGAVKMGGPFPCPERGAADTV